MQLHHVAKGQISYEVCLALVGAYMCMAHPELGSLIFLVPRHRGMCYGDWTSKGSLLMGLKLLPGLVARTPKSGTDWNSRSCKFSEKYERSFITRECSSDFFLNKKIDAVETHNIEIRLNNLNTSRMCQEVDTELLRSGPIICKPKLTIT